MLPRRVTWCDQSETYLAQTFAPRDSLLYGLIMANATTEETLRAPCSDITIVPVESDLTVDDLMPRSAKMSLARLYMMTVAPNGFPRASSVAGFACL